MEDRYSSAFDEVRASDTFKQRMGSVPGAPCPSPGG